jgi:chromosome segregation ATPase
MARSDDPSEEMESMTSDVFLQKLEDLNKQITSRFDATDKSRHQANNSQHTILLNLTTRMDKQDQVLEGFRGSLETQTESLGALTTSLRRIETRLVGDAGLGSTGISQEVADNKVKIATLESRIDNAEVAIEDGNKERATDRKIVLYTIGIVTALGGLVTWLKATGILSWLGK